MPYSGDTYSLPAGTAAVSGATADSADVNSRFSDLETAQNATRPVTAGGTGATSASAARTALGLEIGTDVQAHNAALSNGIVAWASCTGTGTPAINAGSNLTVASIGTGVYRFTFGTPEASANYVVTGNSGNSVNVPGIVTIREKTTTTFTVVTSGLTGAVSVPVDSQFLDVVVIRAIP